MSSLVLLLALHRVSHLNASLLLQTWSSHMQDSAMIVTEDQARKRRNRATAYPGPVVVPGLTDSPSLSEFTPPVPPPSSTSPPSETTPRSSKRASSIYYKKSPAEEVDPARANRRASVLGSPSLERRYSSHVQKATTAVEDQARKRRNRATAFPGPVAVPGLMDSPMSAFSPAAPSSASPPPETPRSSKRSSIIYYKKAPEEEGDSARDFVLASRRVSVLGKPSAERRHSTPPSLDLKRRHTADILADLLPSASSGSITPPTSTQARAGAIKPLRLSEQFPIDEPKQARLPKLRKLWKDVKFWLKRLFIPVLFFLFASSLRRLWTVQSQKDVNRVASLKKLTLLSSGAMDVLPSPPISYHDSNESAEDSSDSRYCIADDIFRAGGISPVGFGFGHSSATDLPFWHVA